VPIFAEHGWVFWAIFSEGSQRRPHSAALLDAGRLRGRGDVEDTVGPSREHICEQPVQDLRCRIRVSLCKGFRVGDTGIEPVTSSV
jgi:hypothetical protein